MPKNNSFGKSQLSIKHEIWSVSYTHLDVYKRQAYHSSEAGGRFWQGCCPCSAHTERPQRCRTDHSQDVYKRQSMDYEKLYKAYYLEVHSYTISLAKNREIAEEITQNIFYKAVSTTSQFKGKSDELTWLCSIAKNLYHDEMLSLIHILSSARRLQASLPAWSLSRQR